MFSVLAASAFLPFLPMTPVQILLLNLIYDVSCLAIPWDNVDAVSYTHLALRFYPLFRLPPAQAP